MKWMLLFQLNEAYVHDFLSFIELGQSTNGMGTKGSIKYKQRQWKHALSLLQQEMKEIIDYNHTNEKQTKDLMSCVMVISYKWNKTLQKWMLSVNQNTAHYIGSIKAWCICMPFNMSYIS